MKWTSQTPTKVGHYWYCDFWNGGVPTSIVEVTKDGGKLWANDGYELCFEVKPKKRTKIKKESDAELWERGLAGGENIEFWCEIPEPEVPIYYGAT